MPPLFLLFLFLFVAHTSSQSLKFGTFKTYMYLGRKPECWLDHGQEECWMHRAFQGYCVAFMELLAGEMKVDYRIDTRKPWAGSLQKDGTWDGLLGDVNASVVDLAIAPIAVTPERAAIVDFSPPFLTSGLSIMVKKTDAQVAWTKRLHSMNPFAPTTWSVIILLQIMSISISIVLYVRMKEAEDWKTRQGRCLIWLFSFLVWIGCTFVLIGSILQHLCTVSALNRLAEPLDELDTISVEEMVRQGKVKFGMQERGEAYQFFKASNDSLFRNMLETMERDGDSSFLSIYESGHEYDGIKKVRSSDGNFALILDDLTNIYESSRLPCNTKKIGGRLATFQYAVATKKGSMLSSKVRSAMESLEASGDLNRLNDEWFAERAQCQNEESDGMIRLPVAERRADYIIYGMSLGVSISIILSLIVAHFEKKRENRPVQFKDEVLPING